MLAFRRLLLSVAVMLVIECISGCSWGVARSMIKQHGSKLVLQVDPGSSGSWPSNQKDRMEVLNATKQILERRISRIIGVTDSDIIILDNDKLVVELPGSADPKRTAEILTTRGLLEFYYLKDIKTPNNHTGKWRMELAYGENKSYAFRGPHGETIDSKKQWQEVLNRVVNVKNNPPVLTGKDLFVNSKATLNQANQIVINIEFNSKGTRIFREFTRSHVDDYLAVFYNSRLLTAPKINEPIPNGRAEISGFRGLREARETADMLNLGTLPVALKVSSVQK